MLYVAVLRCIIHNNKVMNLFEIKHQRNKHMIGNNDMNEVCTLYTSPFKVLVRSVKEFRETTNTGLS